MIVERAQIKTAKELKHALTKQALRPLRFKAELLVEAILAFLIFRR